MTVRRSSSLPRLLAPLALAAAAVALVLVVGTSLDLDGGGGAPPPDPAVEIQQDPVTNEFGRRYTVQPGDSLSTIAEETGVPVDVLSQLNPDLDPQALIAGQRVQLR